MSLTRHKGLKPGGPLRPVSEKRRRLLGPFALSTFLPKRPAPAVPPVRRKSLAERSGGRCEVGLAGCMGLATDPHHRLLRGRGGRRGEAKERLDRLSDLIHCCRWCHDWIHAYPAKARRKGLLLKTGQIPGQELVLYRGEPKYLNDVGDVLGNEEVGA